MCGLNSDHRHLFILLSVLCNMNSVSLASNKWPSARCVLQTLGIMGSRRKTVSSVCVCVCVCVGGGGRVESPQRGSTGSAKQGRNQDSEREAAGRRARREGRDLWTRSGEKWENWSISPCGYSTFMTRLSNWIQRRRGGGGRERRVVYVFFMPVFGNVTHTDFSAA